VVAVSLLRLPVVDSAKQSGSENQK
jgi:hypothetical protein